MAAFTLPGSADEHRLFRACLSEPASPDSPLRARVSCRNQDLLPSYASLRGLCVADAALDGPWASLWSITDADWSSGVAVASATLWPLSPVLSRALDAGAGPAVRADLAGSRDAMAATSLTQHLAAIDGPAVDALPPLCDSPSELTVVALVMANLARLAELGLPSGSPGFGAAQRGGEPLYLGWLLDDASLLAVVEVLECAVHTVTTRCSSAPCAPAVASDAMALLLGCARYVDGLLRWAARPVLGPSAVSDALLTALLDSVPRAAVAAATDAVHGSALAATIHACVAATVSGLWLFCPTAETARVLLDAAVVDVPVAPFARPLQLPVRQSLQRALASLLSQPLWPSATAGVEHWTSGAALVAGGGVHALISRLALQCQSDVQTALGCMETDASVEPPSSATMLVFACFQRDLSRLGGLPLESSAEAVLAHAQLVTVLCVDTFSFVESRSLLPLPGLCAALSTSPVGTCAHVVLLQLLNLLRAVPDKAASAPLVHGCIQLLPAFEVRAAVV